MSINKASNPFECIPRIAGKLNADVLLYSADINDENVDAFIETVRRIESRRENIALVLSTYGGDPDAAYRMTRILKDKYKKFTLLIFGYCKSAGTLIAIGADEIVMSDFAELGPLDVQVLRDDDFRRASGLDLQQALNVLNNQVYDTFVRCFFATIERGSGVITTRTAADIASSMAVGLLAPISSQIDPLRLGEMNRVMSIAYEYGKRLNPARTDTLAKLVSGYPSHSFVIDYKEAQSLFEVVRRPNEDELTLEKVFFKAIRSSSSSELITDLTALAEEALQGKLDEDGDENETSELNNEASLNDGEDAPGANQGDGEQNGDIQGNCLLSEF